MNIIEELYYGNINPNEKGFDRNSKYAKFMKIVADNEEQLTKFLKSLPHSDCKQRELFEQLMQAQGEVNYFTQTEAFIEGFRLGAKFILDTFVVSNESVIRDIK